MPSGIREPIYAPDTTGEFLYGWQLFRELVTAAETAPTAAQLNTNMRSVTDFSHAFRVTDVGNFPAIEVGIWGVADDTESATINLYGYGANGPGYHVGTITPLWGTGASPANTGFHGASNTHKTIRDAFVSSTAYQSPDSLTITNDYTVGSLAVPGTQENNFPVTFVWSFANMRLKYVFPVVTSLTVAGTVTSVGMIFRPLAERPMIPYGT